MNRRLAWTVSILFVLWLFFVLTSFFAVQKPFTAANAAAIGASVLNLLTALWLALIALGLGSWLLARLVSPAWPWPDVVIFGTGLGLGMLGLLSFGVGLLGGFTPLVAYAVTLALTAVSLPPLLRLWRILPHRLALNAPHPTALIYLGLLFLLTLTVALLPPADWDGLFYHLTGPKLYLQAGGIASVASSIDIPHLSFPALMEMLFAWAMLLRGDIAAKLLHLLYGLLLAGLVYRLTQRFWGTKSAWFALLIFGSMPMVNMLAGWAYNDLALAFYQLAAIYSLIQFLTNESAPQPKNAHHSLFTIHCSLLIISGLFAGLAMGLKYTSVVTPLLLIAITAGYAFRRTRNLQFAISNSLAFALPALLVAAPWYLKNWAFTGNPVYPFLFDVFGGQHWDSFRAGWYAAGGTGIGFKPSTLLALPWLLTLGVRDVNYWDGRTGPLLLLFLPLILFGLFRRVGTRRPRAYRLLFVFALAHFLFWIAGVIWSKSLWQSRLLLTGLAALTPLAGAVWANLPRFDRPRFSLSRFVNAAVALTLALTLLDIGRLTLKFDPLPYLVGQESHSAYLTRRLGSHYAVMEKINRELPSEAVVVFLWEPRSYYCQRDCRPDSILDEFPHLVHQYGSAPAIAHHWRASGVTHVLIHRAGLRFVQNESPDAIDWPVLAAVESDFLTQTADVFGAYQLYQLK